MANDIQDISNSPEAAAIKFEIMILGVFFNSIQSSSCSFLVIGLLFVGISIVRHDANI